MSYCRWSSLNWMCDVYCYADVSGGWTTHVAGRRRVREPTPEPDIGAVTSREWVEAHRRTMDELDSIPLKDIGLPHDGETFDDPTLEDFRARLVTLRDLGYIVPKYTFEQIDEEIAEQAA